MPNIQMIQHILPGTEQLTVFPSFAKIKLSKTCLTRTSAFILIFSSMFILPTNNVFVSNDGADKNIFTGNVECRVT